MADPAHPQLNALRARLGALVARERQWRLLAGLGLVVVQALAAVAVFIAVDLLAFSHFEEPGTDRLLRALALAGVLGWIGWAVWTRILRPLRRPLDAEDMALRVEAAHPALQGRLIAALQLSRPGDPLAAGASPSLLRGLFGQTVDLAAPMDFSGVVEARDLLRAAGVAGACVAVAAGLALWRHEESPVALSRLLLSDAQYPAAVRFISLTGDHAVAHGGAAEIIAVVDPARTVPESVTLIVRPAGGRSEVRQELRKREATATGAVFAGRLDPVVEPLEFRVSALDARWPRWQRINVVSPPAILSVETVVTPPDYAKRPATTLSTGDVEALAGSRVAVRLRLSKTLRDGGSILRIQFANRPEQQVPMSVSGDTASAEFAAEADGSWWPDMIDRDGMKPLDPGRWRIRALPDAPPTVELIEPGIDGPSTPRAQWPAAVSARDDLGLSGLSFAWRITPADKDAQPGPEQRRAIPGIDAGTAKPGKDGHVELAGRVDFDLAPLNLQPGQRLTWWIEATDNRQPQAQTARSAERIFAIVTAQQVQEALDRERADLLHKLDQLRQRQEDAKGGVDGLRRDLRGGGP